VHNLKGVGIPVIRREFVQEGEGNVEEERECQEEEERGGGEERRGIGIWMKKIVTFLMSFRPKLKML